MLHGTFAAFVKDVWTESLAEPVAVYNFEVAVAHTYFVSERNVLVHNRNCHTDDIIEETLNKKGSIVSKYTVKENDVLDIGEEFLGKNYTEIGDRGLFQSGNRRFRIDNRSLQGKHKPFVPHFHLEVLDDLGNIITNNHIKFIK